MSLKSKNLNFLHVLQYIKIAEKERRKEDRIQFTLGEMDNSVVLKNKRLKQVYLKCKVSHLVNVFIQKLRKNLKPKNQIKYHKISEILMMKKSQQNYIKTLHIPDLIKLVILIISTICIFIIQILSLWQGLLEDFRDVVAEGVVIYVLKGFCLIVFIIKIGLSMTMQNFVSQSLFLKQRKLIKFYFTSWIFVFDIYFFIISLLLIIFPTSQALGIVSFIISTSSIVVLYRNLKIIQTLYINSYKKKQYWNLFQVLIFNIWSLQIFSFIVLSMVYYDNYYNWIQRAIRNGNMMLNPPWFVKYIYSIYWIVCALASLGFGDLVEGNWVECVCIAFIVYTGFFALSYNVIEVFNIISNIRRLDWQKNYDTMIFKRMIQKQKINNPKLQQKVFKFIDKSAAIKNQPQFLKISNFLQKIPHKLKDQFQEQISKNIFTKIPFFKFLHAETLNYLADQIQRQIYYAGQFIPEKNQKTQKIMILKHGQIGLCFYRQNSSRNGNILQHHKIDQFIDPPYLLNLYLLSPHKQITYDVVAENFCYLYTISLQSFKNCIRMNSKDNQLYFELHNKFLYHDHEWNKFQCQFCLKRKHSIFDCPKLHYMPYKSLKIYRYISAKDKFQFRSSKYKRSHPVAKRKKSLLFWKSYFKFLQYKGPSQYQKKLFQKQKEKQQGQDLQVFIQQQIKDYDGSKRSEQLINNIYQQFFVNLTQIQDDYPLDIDNQFDKMHNFDFFFSKNNPNKLQGISLKTKSRSIKQKLNLKSYSFSNESIQDQS